MKLMIIGSSVLDKIIQNDGSIESPGGIYHTVLKIISLKNEDDSIDLCTQIDYKTFYLFNNVYQLCDRKYFNEISAIPHVRLEESQTGHRTETYCSKAEPLIIKNIDFYEYDGILINMITGYELGLSELKEIRMNTKALIYFDVHTLSRKIEKEGKREFALIPNFELWANKLDIIQVNEFEIFTLFNMNDELAVAKKLLSLGVKVFIVTKGEKGAIVYFKEQGEFSSYFVMANQIKNVSSIGCGDYFGASFFYNYLMTNSAILSLNFAIKQVEDSLIQRRNAT